MISDEQHAACIRIAQEAFNNAVRAAEKAGIKVVITTKYDTREYAPGQDEFLQRLDVSISRTTTKHY